MQEQGIKCITQRDYVKKPEFLALIFKGTQY